MPLKRLDKTYS